MPRVTNHLSAARIFSARPPPPAPPRQSPPPPLPTCIGSLPCSLGVAPTTPLYQHATQQPAADYMRQRERLGHRRRRPGGLLRMVVVVAVPVAAGTASTTRSGTTTTTATSARLPPSPVAPWQLLLLEQAQQHPLQKRLASLLVATHNQQHRHWLWSSRACRPLAFGGARRGDGTTTTTTTTTPLLFVRGGSGSTTAIDWDEPFHRYDDGDDESSDGGANGGASTFLPRDDDDDEEQAPIERSPFATRLDVLQGEEEGAFDTIENIGDEDDDDDDEDAQSDADLLDTPFLSSFQREIHSIVRDYRQEVSDTFQQLMEDILESREENEQHRWATDTSSSRPPNDRSSARRKRPNALEARAERLDRYRPSSAIMEGESEDSDDDDDFVPIDSSVADRFRRDPEASVEQEDEEDDAEEEDGLGFIVGDTDEDEQDVLHRLRDEGSTGHELAWEGEAFGNDEEEPETPVISSDDYKSFDVSDAESSTQQERRSQAQAHAPGVDDPPYNKSGTETGKPRVTKRKKRKSRKASRSRSKLGSPGDRRTRYDDENRGEQAGTSAIVSTRAGGLATTQAWKTLALGVSLFAIAILLNLAIQILKKMLLSSPK